MRMSGELQSHAELRSVPRVPRLVIEQDDRDAFGGAFEDCGKVTARKPSAARRPVGDACENQLAVVPNENDAPIFKRHQPQLGKLRHPRAVTEYIFVVAGDHVDAVNCPQVPQRLDVVASRIERAVDQISRDRDQVHAEFVSSLDDGACP